MNEADTCRMLVRPKLEAAGWDGNKHFYRFAKTIVFCVDQEHADQMRRAIHNRNTDLAQDAQRQGEEYVARVTADERDIGREFLSKF